MMPADCKPLCAAPELLPLVDLTFERGKAANAAARELSTYCRRCPVASECLLEFNSSVHGVWAATRRKRKGTGSINTHSPIKVVAA